jgi:glycosyltransferase involved in cell wall biosynthesis
MKRKKNKQGSILQISSVHFCYDPRIYFRNCKTLSAFFDVQLIIPCKEKPEITDFRVIPVPFFKKLLFRILFVHPIILFKCLYSKAKIIHIHDPELIPIALIMKILGRKSIYDVHENTVEQIKQKKYNKHYVYRKCFLLLNKVAAGTMPLILAEDSYLKHYTGLSQRIHIVRNFPDTAFISTLNILPEKGIKKDLFYLGGISIERGLLPMIHALEILSKDDASIHLQLIGPLYITKKEFAQIISKVKTRIEYHGVLPLDKALYLANNAICGLALLQNMANYTQSYPSKIFEYMALGLPVICSDFPLYKSVVEKNGSGFCIPSGNHHALAEKIKELRNNDNLWKSMSGNARQAVQTSYNWKSESKELLRAYNL